eukprot:746195-Hanusia_phi.AAC.1
MRRLSFPLRPSWAVASKQTRMQEHATAIRRKDLGLSAPLRRTGATCSSGVISNSIARMLYSISLERLIAGSSSGLQPSRLRWKGVYVCLLACNTSSSSSHPRPFPSPVPPPPMAPGAIFVTEGL